MPHVRRAYKIHALPTTEHGHCQANEVFYETEQEALDRVQEIFNTQPTAPAMVIYRAYLVLERQNVPMKATVLLT